MIPALEKLKCSYRDYTKLMHLIKLWKAENNVQYSAREKVMGDIGLELSLEVKTEFSIAKVWSTYWGGGAQLKTECKWVWHIDSTVSSFLIRVSQDEVFFNHSY